MSNIKELKEEDLEKVSGGCWPFLNNGNYYNRKPGGSFDNGDIVEEDFTGIRYQIIQYNSSEGSGDYFTNWYEAEVVYVPESQKNSTSIGSKKFVNSSFVYKVG